MRKKSPKPDLTPSEAIKAFKDEVNQKFDELNQASRVISDLCNSVLRRIDTLQHTADLLHKERDILEDIQGGLRKVEEIMLANRTHQRDHLKDLKADVKQVEEKVEMGVGDVKDKIDDIPKETVSEILDGAKGGSRLVRKITKIFGGDK